MMLAELLLLALLAENSGGGGGLPPPGVVPQPPPPPPVPIDAAGSGPIMACFKSQNGGSWVPSAGGWLTSDQADLIAQSLRAQGYKLGAWTYSAATDPNDVSWVDDYGQHAIEPAMAAVAAAAHPVMAMHPAARAPAPAPHLTLPRLRTR